MMCVPTYIKYWCKRCHLPFTKSYGDCIAIPTQLLSRCPYCGSTKLSKSFLGSFTKDFKKGKNKDGKSY